MFKQTLKALFFAITSLSIITAWYISPILKPFPKLSGHYSVAKKIIFLIDEKRAEIYSENPSDKRALETHIYYPINDTQGLTKSTYFGKKLPILKTTFASLYKLPQIIVKLLFYNIKTNTFSNAPLSDKEKSYPVILYSHGLLGSPSELSQTLLTDIASNGYIVIGINHPYFNSMTFTPDGKIVSSQSLESEFKNMPPAEQENFQTHAIETYKTDIQFLLDQLKAINDDPTNTFYKRLDLNHIGVMGHSAGGTAAIEMCRSDQRCKAVINLDGWYNHIIGDDPISQPLLLMFASKSLEVGEPTTEYLKRKNLTREQYFRREEKIAKHRKELCNTSNCSMIIIQDAEHGDFSDSIFLKWPLREWNAADSYKTMNEINNHIVHFFNAQLKSMNL